MGLQLIRLMVASVITFYMVTIVDLSSPTQYKQKGPECSIVDDQSIDTCPPAQLPCEKPEDVDACRPDTDDAPGNALYSCSCGKPVANTGDLNPKCKLTGDISIDTCPPAQQGCPNQEDIIACVCTEPDDCVCQCGPQNSDDAYNIGD